MSQIIQSVIIVGAGPVGGLLSLMLARQGYHVTLLESRDDPRQCNHYQDKSINIALSDRGWLALESIGIAEEIKSEAIPMYHRTIHNIEGKITKQAYGNEYQAIWSIARSNIVEKIISLIEKEKNISIRFGCSVTDVDFENCTVTTNSKQGEVKFKSDLLFGADGAFSKIRRNMQEIPRKRISYSLDYMPQSYIELHIPAASDGTHQLEKQSLHIWPRKDFMLIALPNLDGSFTCTLFINHEGEVSFEKLTKRQDVNAFFHTYFNDVQGLINNPIDEFIRRTPSPLSLVQIYPWVVNNTVTLIGDAAHSMVPFYGQGMNSGFEDCRVLNELIIEQDHDWPEILHRYQTLRKPNVDAITELSKRNFVEMSELSGDPWFQLSKKIEVNFHNRYPELWITQYSMVTFSPHISYSEALRIGDIQTEIMRHVMAFPDIENRWQNEDIYKMMHQLTTRLKLKG